MCLFRVITSIWSESDNNMGDSSSTTHHMLAVLNACFPIANGIGSPTAGYRHLHHQAVKVAGQTILHHSTGIDAWHDAMSLTLRTVSGKHEFQGSEDERGSKSLRFSFIVGAMLTSKTALDTCLSGQYVQSMMMCRHLVESWIRIAYLGLHPNSARNWFRTGKGPPQPVKNQKMVNQLKLNSDYAENASKALLLIAEADKYAHPSPEAMASVYGASLAHGILGTVYKQHMASLTIHIAASSCLLIADEIPQIIPLSQAFRDEVERIDQQLQEWDREQFASSDPESRE